MILAVNSDPITILSSGNVLLILALIIVVLASTLLYVFRLYLKMLEKNSQLQDKRLEDAIINRDKYDTVMGKFSLSFDLFIAKLQSKEK